ncbi:MAG TPA: hypothetical protein VE954_09735 [Oligoflexus sp.]|nr:hypothetical protein [Oligoflexus sp.]HYX33382.1 hypothetical protein [Oligoflexus sp.]
MAQTDLEMAEGDLKKLEDKKPGWVQQPDSLLIQLTVLFAGESALIDM